MLDEGIEYRVEDEGVMGRFLLYRSATPNDVERFSSSRPAPSVVDSVDSMKCNTPTDEVSNGPPVCEGNNVRFVASACRNR